LTTDRRVDFLVIGSGPSGQKAAVQAAKEGRSVLVVEREAAVGGECVHRGTIPSKTLRENAAYLAGLRQRSGGVLDVELSPDLKLSSLMRRLKGVLEAHERFLGDQLARNGVALARGRARFVAPRVVEIESLGSKGRTRVEADVVVIATGSRPRSPAEVPVDHENVLDSDSILSLPYLPRSLVILGGGVIACEFASIFAVLGVEVTMLDKHPRPLSFLDEELTSRFVAHLESDGGCFLPGASARSVQFDGLSSVRVELDDGRSLVADKVLCALGRVANVEGLGLAAAGLAVNERGFIPVDEFCRTSAERVYAVGDVNGPPALAATAVEQGMRAARHALGLDPLRASERVPIGIYTIPEIACVGLSESAARQQHGQVLTGRAPFHELARGQISANTRGFLKLVADADGQQLLGAHIIGEGATELIHVAQMALVAGLRVDTFLENVFNFPTLAEAYRVAALDVLGRRRALRRAG
jgi:NAD(P) transhydrogenase